MMVDECSMVPVSMWSALLNVTFTGHSVVVLGDPDGQFAPIEDQHRMEQWEGLWDSRFMCDLCGGLRITLCKYRRKEEGKPIDYEHFKFVGGLYPHHKVSLEDAVPAASAIWHDPRYHSQVPRLRQRRRQHCIGKVGRNVRACRA